MNRKTTITLFIIYLVFWLLVIGCSYLFSSCTTTRYLKSSLKDSTQLVKMDSGHVSVNTNTKTDSINWWREIINFFPKGRDTVINNTTVPVNNYYPAQIIREGGNQKTQEVRINYDSLWNNKIDSLVLRISQNQKDSKTTVLGFWQILSLACAGVIVLYVSAKLGKKFL